MNSRMWHLYIFVYFFRQSAAFVIQEGEFVQTNMFYEPHSCKTSAIYNNLTTESSLSLSYCGVQCFGNLDCRRIMFDRKTKQCSMFESGENCFYHENIEDKICYRLKSVCSDVNCTRCPIGYYGDTCQHIIQDCSDGKNKGFKETTLMSFIQPAENLLEVKCNFKYGLTYFQHRYRGCLETNFTRTWDEYVNGFGNKHGEHWLGLQNIYDILQNHDTFQLSVMVVIGGKPYYGNYHQFTLSNSTEGFKFYCESYTTLAPKPLGDALTNGTNTIQGQPFSTYDRDNSNNDCTERFKVGWWYLDGPECSRANPNGRRSGIFNEEKIHWLEDDDIKQIKLSVKRM